MCLVFNETFKTRLVWKKTRYSKRVSFFRMFPKRVLFSERVTSSWHIEYPLYRDDFCRVLLAWFTRNHERSFLPISLVYQKPWEILPFSLSDETCTDLPKFTLQWLILQFFTIVYIQFYWWKQRFYDSKASSKDTHTYTNSLRYGLIIIGKLLTLYSSITQALSPTSWFENKNNVSIQLFHLRW